MVDGKKVINISLILIGIFFYNCLSIAMEKPYHHLPDGTFRNPEGSPKRDPNVKWSYKIFNQEKKKLDMTVPKDHVVEKEKVLSDLKKYQDDDYVAWIGHATFLIKLGETTIITDPVFSKNAGPLIFGPDRFTEPALKLNEIPKIELFFIFITKGFPQFKIFFIIIFVTKFFLKTPKLLFYLIDYDNSLFVLGLIHHQI